MARERRSAQSAADGAPNICSCCAYHFAGLKKLSCDGLWDGDKSIACTRCRTYEEDCKPLDAALTAQLNRVHAAREVFDSFQIVANHPNALQALFETESEILRTKISQSGISNEQSPSDLQDNSEKTRIAMKGFARCCFRYLEAFGSTDEGDAGASEMLPQNQESPVCTLGLTKTRELHSGQNDLSPLSLPAQSALEQPTSPPAGPTNNQVSQALPMLQQYSHTITDAQPAHSTPSILTKDRMTSKPLPRPSRSHAPLPVQQVDNRKTPITSPADQVPKRSRKLPSTPPRRSKRLARQSGTPVTREEWAKTPIAYVVLHRPDKATNQECDPKDGHIGITGTVAAQLRCGDDIRLQAEAAVANNPVSSSRQVQAEAIAMTAVRESNGLPEPDEDGSDVDLDAMEVVSAYLDFGFGGDLLDKQ